MVYLGTVVSKEVSESQFFSDVNWVCINLFLLVCRMTLIFLERKDMILDKFPNILHMVIRPILECIRVYWNVLGYVEVS